MSKLLITGFGPFPRVPRNPSASLAREVAADPRWRRLGIVVEALVLETRYSAIDTHLIPKIRDFEPDAILMLGVAGRRRHVGIETRAMNRVSRLMPDAGGCISSQLTYRPGAPLALRSHAPLDRMMRAMRRRGVDARLSRDAGRYLCNAAYFAALAEMGRTPELRVAFIHIPMPRIRGRAREKDLSRHSKGFIEERKATLPHSSGHASLTTPAVEVGRMLLLRATSAKRTKR